jgi:hypothetical protein
MCKVSETGVVRGSVAPPLVISWGVSFINSNKTWYVYCSHQDGQLSNWHELSATNRERDILVWMWIFWRIFSPSLCVSVCVGEGGDLTIAFTLLIKVSGAFGVLNVLKNSWNFAHKSEPPAIRDGLKLVPGLGRGAQQRPLERSPKTWSIDQTRLHELIWNSVLI